MFSVLHVFTDLYKVITTLEKIRNDKMPINELSSQLLSAGVPLSNKAFQEILNETSTDGEFFERTVCTELYETLILLCAWDICCVCVYFRQTSS